MIAALLLAAATASAPPPPVHQVELTTTDIQVLTAIVQKDYVGSRCSANDQLACQAEPLLDDMLARINAQANAEAQAANKAPPKK